MAPYRVLHAARLMASMVMSLPLSHVSCSVKEVVLYVLSCHPSWAIYGLSYQTLGIILKPWISLLTVMTHQHIQHSGSVVCSYAVSNKILSQDSGNLCHEHHPLTFFLHYCGWDCLFSVNIKDNLIPHSWHSKWECVHRTYVGINAAGARECHLLNWRTMLAY